MKSLIGADPEIFLRDKKTSEYVSAAGIVPGTKEKPHRVDHGAVQLDGTAFEINIDAAETFPEFKKNLDAVLEQAKGYLPDNLEMAFEPVVEYEPKYFESLPNSQKQLGCDPDWDAATGRTNPAPRRLGSMATGGGHIHLGWTKDQKVSDLDHMWDARQMTLRLHSYFSRFIPFWDPDTRRGGMYGAGSAYRPKPYGTEYRTPSNAWLKYPELWEWMFNSTKFVFKHAVEQKQYMGPDRFGGDLMYITPGRLLGYDKNGLRVFDTPGSQNSRYTPEYRKQLARQEITTIFGDNTFPMFPEDFKQVPMPPVKLAKDAHKFAIPR